MKSRFLCALTILIIICILGLHQKGVVFFEYKGEKEGNFEIKITSDAEEKNYYLSYEGIVQGKKFIIYVPKEIEKLNYGDKIIAKANFSEAQKARNAGCFDYSLYLKTKKIYGIFKVENITKIEKAKQIPVIKKLQDYIKNSFKSNLKSQNSDLAIALILGDRSNISKQVQENFKTANLTHLLAISGAHFSYVILAINLLLKKLKNKRFRQIILLLSILFFMNLTGNTPSVCRAGIMSIMTIIASMLKRKNNFYTTLCVSLLIQIAANPYTIFDLGLILSYSGVLGIVLFYDFFYEKIKLKIVSVTLSANVFIVPIMIYNFNTISFTFLISNVLASGLLGIIVIMELFLSCFPVKPLFVILDIFLSLLKKIAEFCANLPFSKVYVTNNTIFVVLAIYLIVYLIIKKRKKLIPIIVLTIIVFNITCTNINKDKLQINFIDVNQGDCSLLLSEGKSLMIDTGGNTNTDYDIGENILHRYLLYKGISRLNYLMLSHFDADHCQASLFLLKNMKIDNLIISKQIETSDLYEQIINIAKQKKIKVIYVAKGIKMHVGKLDIEILNPDDNFITENKLNNNAIVCKISYYNFKMLFTGDIEKIAENKLLKENLSADLLKVAHHGSKTSTTQAFLDKVNPKIALIGVGENNKFGHPNSEVIERLNNKKIKIFRTDKNGEINLIVNSKGEIKAKQKY